MRGCRRGGDPVRKLSAPVLLLLSLASSGCSLRLSQESSGGVAKNECKSDADCGDGSCRLGMCVAHEGALDTFLLSVIPPTDASGVGGARFLSIAQGLSRSHQDFHIDIHRVSTVAGFFRVPDAGCVLTADASGTVPVEVVFTAHESSYGLPSSSYVARTGAAAPATGPCLDAPGLTGPIREFSVDVPAGLYDVYVRPLVDPSLAASAGCSYPPELIHDFSVDERAQCRPLTLSPPQTLGFDVTPPNGGTLDGWSVDMLHPTTGQRISGEVTLPPLGTATSYSASVRYSKDPTVPPGKEIVRLSPPADRLEPTIHFELSGLTATSIAATPPLGIFPDPVRLEAWIWSAKDFANNREVLVPASVKFTARKLAGILDGVVASYGATVESDGKGLLGVTLLPGTYRVEVVPQVGLGFSATEVDIEIPCDRDPSAPDLCQPGTGTLSKHVQSGRVVLVPKAASVAGALTEPRHGDRIDGASIQLSPATVGQARCDADGGACPGRALHLFDTLLGGEAFVPRSATAISSQGDFTLPEVDCGACVTGSGAFFDLSASAPDGSRLPWLVHPSLDVEVGRVDLGEIRVKLPIVQWGVVQVPRPQAEPVLVPRASIRAYVLRDQDGNTIADPTGMPSCADPARAAVGTSSTSPCVRSVLQVAETRTRDDGSFELILPSALDSSK